jgi:hypothetical protein
MRLKQMRLKHMRRTGAFLLYVVTGAALCQAQTPADMSACANVADEKSRLKCYDEHMARAGHPVTAPRAVPATKPAPAPQAASPSPAPQRTAAARPASEEFGLDPDTLRKRREASSPGTAQPEEMVGRVKSVSTRARGEYRIELEDGQVWVETLRTGGMPPEAGETVTIKRGTLGSFFMSRNAGVALRVKRLK